MHLHNYNIFSHLNLNKEPKYTFHFALRSYGPLHADLLE